MDEVPGDSPVCAAGSVLSEYCSSRTGRGKAATRGRSGPSSQGSSMAELASSFGTRHRPTVGPVGRRLPSRSTPTEPVVAARIPRTRPIMRVPVLDYGECDDRGIAQARRLRQIIDGHPASRTPREHITPTGIGSATEDAHGGCVRQPRDLREEVVRAGADDNGPPRRVELRRRGKRHREERCREKKSCRAS